MHSSHAAVKAAHVTVRTAETTERSDVIIRKAFHLTVESCHAILKTSHFTVTPSYATLDIPLCVPLSHHLQLHWKPNVRHFHPHLSGLVEVENLVEGALEPLLLLRHLLLDRPLLVMALVLVLMMVLIIKHNFTLSRLQHRHIDTSGDNLRAWLSNSMLMILLLLPDGRVRPSSVPLLLCGSWWASAMHSPIPSCQSLRLVLERSKPFSLSSWHLVRRSKISRFCWKLMVLLVVFGVDFER